jgi:hypothetical protein
MEDRRQGCLRDAQLWLDPKKPLAGELGASESGDLARPCPLRPEMSNGGLLRLDRKAGEA